MAGIPKRTSAGGPTASNFSLFGQSRCAFDFVVRQRSVRLGAAKGTLSSAAAVSKATRAQASLID